MASRFKMQIVDTVTGRVVEWEPGLSTEINFVEDCISRIVERGVGFGRTSKHVAKDIEDGITEAIFNLKKKVRAKI